MTSRSYFFAAVFLILAISSVLAAVFGFVSPDAWNYLYLAQSVKAGEWCSIDGSFAAFFPCGYPMVLAFLSPYADLAGLLLSSKIINAFLLFASFLFLNKVFRNVLTPILIIINPITLAIQQNTWSENLLLFAICGSLWAIAGISEREHSSRYVPLLGIFLIAGCAARYFFGPFACIMLIGVGVVYGWKPAVKTLPAFAAAGLFFLAYQYFNYVMTGYGSGMPRIPAPESMLYLIWNFLREVIRDWMYLSISVLLLLSISIKNRALVFAFPRGDDHARPHYYYLAFIGLGFLVLGFMLRARVQYDLYNLRTIGYGSVFAVAACVGLLTRLRSERYAMPALLFCGCYGILSAQGKQLPLLLKDVFLHGYESPASALNKYYSPAIEADEIVALSVPKISDTVAGWSLLYYKAGVNIIELELAPYRKAETADEFKNRLRSRNPYFCVIDFNAFPTLESFKASLESAYPVDYKFSSILSQPEIVVRPSFDPSLKAYLLAVFQAGRYAPCKL